MLLILVRKQFQGTDGDTHPDAVHYPASDNLDNLLPELGAAITRAETDKGRYRWWVDGAIGIARWIPNVWYLRFPKLTHLAYRHICSLFAGGILDYGGWREPLWLERQECPFSPNDLLFAVRRT